jgi:hypothetical protein
MDPSQSAGSQMKQMRKQIKTKGGKKPARERQYHNVEVAKLSKAFED